MNHNFWSCDRCSHVNLAHTSICTECCQGRRNGRNSNSEADIDNVNYFSSSEPNPMLLMKASSRTVLTPCVPPDVCVFSFENTTWNMDRLLGRLKSLEDTVDKTKKRKGG
eukprot:PhF_6_TR9188/c1_g1_i1/m.14337